MILNLVLLGLLLMGRPPPPRVPGWGWFKGAWPIGTVGTVGGMTRPATPIPASAITPAATIPTLTGSTT